MSMETILARGREVVPGLPPGGVFIRSERTSWAAVSFGKETVFINPYTGDVVERGSKTHQFMRRAEDWRRWLGSREIGKPVTGLATAALFILVLTGPYLRRPKRWTGAVPNTITRLNLHLPGKAREWNRHIVIGFWSAPAILIISLTGLVMSYQWANDRLYRLIGNASPPPPVQEGAAPLTLNPPTADVMKWEPFSEYNLARRFHAWVRPLRTGIAGGVAGPMLAGVGAMGGVMRVWTGLAMAWRRIFHRKPGPVTVPGATTEPMEYEPAGPKPASFGS